MIYCFHDFVLDENRYELRQAGTVLKVEPKVFELLLYLVQHHDRFISREELIEKLWPEVVVGEAVLTQCVAKARKAVTDDGEKQQIIKTQHGRGYRFVAHVIEQQEPPHPSSLDSQQEPSIIDETIHPTIALKVAQFTESFFSSWQIHTLYGRSIGVKLLGLFLALAIVAILRQPPVQPTAPQSGDLISSVRTTGVIHDTEAAAYRAWSLSLNSREASAYVLRAWDYYDHFTPEANTRARVLFEQAIARDPQYIAAYVGVGWTYLIEWSSFWTQDAQNLDTALLFTQKALALDADFPPAHALQAYVYLLQRRYEQAIAAGEQSIKLGSTCAECHAILADILTFTGQPRRAIDIAERARQLNPSATTSYAAILGRAYYLIGQADLAVEALRRAVIRNPNTPTLRLNLALAYDEVGCRRRAQAEVAEILRLNPHLTLQGLRERIPHQNAGQAEYLLTALHKVGLR